MANFVYQKLVVDTKNQVVNVIELTRPRRTVDPEEIPNEIV